MRKLLFRCVAVTLVLASVTASAESELEGYVGRCESELGFNASDVQPMNCNDGVNFAPSTGIVNDFLLYQRVNYQVDITVACRWLNNSSGGPSAASVELIIHNRSKGSTCFFSAKDGAPDIDPVTGANRPVSTNIVSPTAFPSADSYWLQPSDLNNKTLQSHTSSNNSVVCVGCHVAGPYIASPRIVQYLAQFGLINDGHDTFADPGNSSKHYHAVTSNGTAPYNNLPTLTAFQQWDSIIAANRVQEPCNRACHSIADNSTTGTLTQAGLQTPLLPSIQSDIALIKNAGSAIMPPADFDSDYRWMNHSNAGGTGDWELLKDEAAQFPGLYDSCPNPTRLEAHVVGSDKIFANDDLPDQLRTFNLRDGLVCINADQPSGQCHDYSTRYLCAMPAGGGSFWTDWINNDSATSGKGDFERRTDPGYANLCVTYDPRNLHPINATPIAMQAETQSGLPQWDPVNKRWVTPTRSGYAPNEQLRNFDPSYGLACVKSDQPDGHCSNYVVRFICSN